MQTTYKFTDPGRRPTHGINDYPEVGEWSESRTPVPCKSGWHVPTRQGLSVWLAAELWEVEVDGASVSRDDKAAHERIRFIRKVEAWTPQVAADFAAFCAERAQAQAADTDHATNAGYAAKRASYHADDSSYYAVAYNHAAATTAFYATSAATYAINATSAAASAADVSAWDGGLNEREAQAAWLCERLGLEVAE